MSTVLITRPLIQARLYAAELEALEHKTIVDPMLSFEALGFEVPDLSTYQGLLFTSAHAVKVFVACVGVCDLPVFCVGTHTESVAKERGFTTVYETGGNAEKMVAFVTDHCTDQTKPLLHVRGEHVAKPLHVLLAGHGFQVDLLHVYKTAQATEFSEGTLAALQEGAIDMVVFFSARTAQAFMNLIRDYKLEEKLAGLKALSISESVLECVDNGNWNGCFVASTPDKAGMTGLIQESGRDE